MKTAFLTALTILSMSSAAHSATFGVENNAPGGDYADGFGATTNNFGSISLGYAEVQGELSCNSAACTGGLNDSFDAWFFTIDPGTQAENLFIGTEGGGNNPLDPNNTLFVTAQLLNDTGGTVFSENFEINTSNSLPNVLSAGTYNFGISFENIGDFEDGGDAFYIASFDVVNITPVPLPASLPLLLAGFGGLMTFRRRQSRAN